MAVPHTRPIAVTHHANNPDLLSGDSPWRGELRIPSSAQALVELRLGEWSHDAMGFVAHIPHYLAQLDYPQASVSLLEHVERAAMVTVDLTDLREASDARDEEVTTYLAGNAEVAEVVQALEQQYDAFQRAEQEGNSLLADDEPIPTGEEIGRQFEQFLAGLDTPEGESLMPSSAAELVELLDIETLDTDLFRGRSPDTDRQRVFGGQVAAQALIAAIRTVGGGPRRALDARLLPAARRHHDPDHLRRRADPRRPLLRDPAGGGAPARPADLLPDRELPAPRGGLRPPGRDARGADARRGADVRPDRRSSAPATPRPAAEFAKEWAALDTRYLGNSVHPGHTRLKEDTDRPARAQVWIRVDGELGDDPDLHVAAFTYASDLTLLGAALVPHDVEIGSPRLMPASLDHTIWFHRPFRADRWWLYDQWSPSASGAPRALARPGLHRGRPPGRHGRPGGPDPPAHPLSRRRAPAAHGAAPWTPDLASRGCDSATPRSADAVPVHAGRRSSVATARRPRSVATVRSLATASAVRTRP